MDLTISNEELVVCLAERYNLSFPKYPPLVTYNEWLYGVWLIGNDYRNMSGGYYGAYPRSLLKRYGCMFGDFDKVLHLFSGSLPKSVAYTRFDIQGDTDVKGDALRLSNCFEKDSFDIIFADPPYSKKDAEKYGTGMPNRLAVMNQIFHILNPGGLVIWLDTSFPMYKKKFFKLLATIGIVRSTNHRVRCVFIFRKHHTTS